MGIRAARAEAGRRGARRDLSAMSDETPRPGGSDFLSTGHLLAGLKARSLRGGAITVSAEMTKYGVDVLAVAVLARLLTPEDFGLVAMVVALLGFIAAFKDAGLSLATIQRERLSHEQVSALFWLNVALSLVLVAAVAAAGRGVAWFYGDERLVGITLALGGTYFFSGLTVQHAALLRRQMRFRELAWVEIGAHAMGTAAAVAMALRGWGYWALVLRAIATPFSLMLAVWIAMPWRPAPPWRARGARSLVRFGGYLAAFRVTNYVGRNIDNVLVGRFLGGSTLGLYSKAYSLLMLPLRMVSDPISDVAVPALSRLQSDPGRMRAFYYKAVGLVVMLSMPVVAWVAAVADSFVLTLLGEQWVATVHLFHILTIPAFIGTFNVATGWVFVSSGQVRRQLACGVVNTALGALAIAVGLRWGIEGVAWAIVVSALVRRLPTVAYCYRGTPFTLRGLGEVLWRPAAASVFAGLLTFGVHGWMAPGAGRPMALLASLPVFGAAYLAALALLPGGRALLGELQGHLRILRARPAEALG
jgi:O-antigen/teichoic acid export membrane protein